MPQRSHGRTESALLMGVVIATAASVAALTSCESSHADHEPDHDSSRSARDEVAAGESDAARAEAAKDAEILALLVAVNEHEIKLSDEAKGKSLLPEVKDYAAMLHTEHKQNLEDTEAVADNVDLSPDTTDQVKAFREKGAAELDRLEELHGADFDRAFIDAMVTGHQEVLALIDDRLLRDVSAPALKRHLETTREHMAQHLAEAKRLQEAQPR